MKKLIAAFSTMAIMMALVLTFGLSSVQAKAIEGVVNVNTATPAQLVLLPGIGKAKAQAIVEQRKAKPFASLEDLKAVKGIGPKRLEALRPHVAFSGATTAKVSGKKAAPAKAKAEPTKSQK